MYTPSDTLIGPIIEALARIIETQVEGVDRVYRNVPDGPPEDNSVVVPLTRFEILDETNGKLTVQLTFGLRHLVRRAEMSESLANCYSYVMPYLLVFSSWSNQDLGGKARLVSVTDGGISQFIEANQVFLSLAINVQVLTEFNIPVSNF